MTRTDETPSCASTSDLDLARRVVAGSPDAWSTFIERYGRLIQAVIRRHAGTADDDGFQDLFVRVLEALYRKRLASYRGEARLSTWLTIVVRNLAIDDLRRRIGRKRIPRCIARLAASDRLAYELVVVQRLPFDILRERLGSPPIEEVVATLERVDVALDGRLRLRLAYEAWGEELGVPGPVLRFLDDAMRARAASPAAMDPEQLMIAKEHAAQAREVRALMHRLPEQECAALRLRYLEGRSTPEIASTLAVPVRRVYKILAMAIARLRRMARAEDWDVGF